MKELKNISVSRIVLLILISIYVNNIYFYLISVLFILMYSIKQALVYIVLLLMILITNSITIDLLPFGIVEKSNNNYYIVDKIFYKTQIYNEELEIGDIIYSSNATKINSIDLLKKNIRFKESDYKLIGNLKIRNLLYNHINSFEDNISIGLNKFLYNINNYDDISYNLGYGLSIYYLIRLIVKKNRIFGIIFILIYSLLFYFDPKFILIIIDFLLYKTKNNRFWYKLLIIILINKCLLYNYSILIPLLFQLRNNINIKLNFHSYLLLIESILFGSIDVFSIFIFKYLINIQIILLIISIIVICFPILGPIYGNLLNIYSLINSLSLEIRGSITIIGFILFYLLNKIFLNKSSIKEFLLILLIILSPFNIPFLKVSFIDVGQGDSSLIKLPFYRCNILIDTGSKYNYYKLSKYLKSNSIYTIDYLIVTHNDSDHNGNIDNILNDFNVKNIITTNEDINMNSLKLKNLYIDNFDNDNDNSLVYILNVNNITFLFTGDISSKAERKLINKYPNIDVDILKSSHHGSNSGNSEYFISNILPEIAIISTSGMYGHPSKETIDTYNDYLVDYYVTKDSGNIEFIFAGALNYLKTSKGEFVIIR